MAKEIKNIIINKIHAYWLEYFASRYVTGRMIDIGCGTKPYKDLFAPYVYEHIGFDHHESLHNSSNIDNISTAYNLSAEDSSFDSAICTAVLEHLEEPEQALRECFRVLKSGGTAVYSVPFIWHLHEEPRDFYRFTKYGLVYLFEKSGFEILELKALSGFWLTFGQLFVYNLYRFNLGPLKWLRIIDMVGLMIQALVFCMDKVDKTEQWTWMYMVVVRKP